MAGASLLSEWLNRVSSRSTWKSGAKLLLFLQNMGSVIDLIFPNENAIRLRVGAVFRVRKEPPFF